MDRPDLAWKLMLQRRLPEVLASLFPDFHALVDWTREYCLPDKRLPPPSVDSPSGEREPDFVALVALRDGGRACIHVEVQCTRQADFAARMELYHARLRDRFAMPVFSLAILGDPSPSWRPDSITELRNGCGTTFRFPIAKLLDLRDRLDLLLASRAPVALALACHLIAIATRRQPELRYAAKRRLLQPLHERRCPKRELNELQAVIDWMLPLPPELQRRMVMDIDEFILEHEKEDKNSLNYLIPEILLQMCKKRAEEEGLAKGRATGLAEGRVEGLAEGRVEGLAEGRVEGLAEGRIEGLAEGKAEGEAAGMTLGQRQTLKLQLEARFGPLHKQLLGALAQAGSPQLEQLAVALLHAGSAEEALHAAGLHV